MNSKTIIGVVVALVVVLGGWYFLRPAVQPPLGASGTDFYSRVALTDNVTIGGNRLATSSIGAATYTAANIASVRTIEHIAASALTATLPTAASLASAGFLPNVGDTATIYLHASTTKITLAGNTNVTLHSASSTKDVSAGSIGRLDFVRLGATENSGYWVLLSAD